MTEDEFVGLVGDRLTHVTAERNGPSIRARGLLRPVTLARLAGIDAESLVLRRTALELALPEGGSAWLNHQLPLRAGRRQAFLDGASLEEWSRQLDERVFFWPGRALERFEASLEAREPSALLVLDTRRVFRTLRAALDLAPINSGSALRRPAPRGRWIYTPVAAEVAEFREARRRRGLVASPDRVAEVSLRADIPPGLLAELLAEGWPA